MLAVTVSNDPTVPPKLPVVTLDVTKTVPILEKVDVIVPTVALVCVTFAAVTPPDTLTFAIDVVVPLKSVPTDAFVENTPPDVTVLVTATVATVNPVLVVLGNVSVPTKLTLPSVTVRYAGEIKGVDLLAESAI